MTKNHPVLRKAASNADLYSDPPPPRPLRHSYSTLSRAHTTASASASTSTSTSASAAAAYRPRHGERGARNKHVLPEWRSRHSIAGPFADLFDVDDFDAGVPPPSKHQNPPPVPPKIPEVPVPLPPAPSPARAKEVPEQYTKPFTDFMTANPTIFHAVDAVAKDLEKNGYKKLSERDTWHLKAGGKVSPSFATT